PCLAVAATGVLKETGENGAGFTHDFEVFFSGCTSFLAIPLFWCTSLLAGSPKCNIGVQGALSSPEKMFLQVLGPLPSSE
ncbi:hypothetical protein P7K49_022525, partial [Saguinus oedipus]